MSKDYPDGEDHPHSTLTDDEAVEIRERYRDDPPVTERELADEFGVGRHVVDDVIHGVSYPQAGGPIAGEDYEPEPRPPDTPTGEDHPNHVGREGVLDDIIAGYLVLGTWPRYGDYREFGTHATLTIQRRFGSYPAAVEAAKERYEDTREEWHEAVE